MATLTLDTYEFIEGLKEAGVPERQAKAIAEGLKKINLEHVASKEDIAELKVEIQRLEAKILKWVVPLLLAQIAVFASIVKFLEAS